MTVKVAPVDHDFNSNFGDKDKRRPSQRLTTWIVNPYDDIPGEGRPELRFWSLARELCLRGHDVTWWTANWSHRTKTTRFTPPTRLLTKGFSVQIVPVRPYRKNVSLARLLSHKDYGKNFVRMATEGIRSGAFRRPDVVLASLPPFESCQGAVRLARCTGATFILDVMDLWPETFSRLLPQVDWLQRYAGRLLFRRMAQRRNALVAEADAISAPCRTYLDAVTLKAARRPPCHICFHGCNLEQFASASPGTPRLPADMECIYAGSLEVSQDLDSLLSAAKQLSCKNIRVTIHIAGTGSLEAKVRRCVEKQQGSCRLVFHGLLGAEGYSSLLSRCHVGLVCVRTKSMVAMPYKAADYAAAGLAIISSLPGELGALLRRYDAGIPYESEDPSSLADAIARLANNKLTLIAMQKQARILAEREFDRRKSYNKFAEWIEEKHRDGPSPSTPHGVSTATIPAP